MYLRSENNGNSQSLLHIYIIQILDTPTNWSDHKQYVIQSGTTIEDIVNIIQKYKHQVYENELKVKRLPKERMRLISRKMIIKRNKERLWTHFRHKKSFWVISISQHLLRGKNIFCWERSVIQELQLWTSYYEEQ